MSAFAISQMRQGSSRMKKEDVGSEEPHLVRTLEGHKGAVSSVAFSSNGKRRLIASGAMDASVMLWLFGNEFGSSSRHNEDDERPLQHRPTRAFRFAGHRGPVHRVAFSDDGAVLASASSDRCVRLWTPSARGESVELKGHAGPVRCVDFSPDSQKLLTASDDKTVKVWALPSRKFVCTLGATSQDIGAGYGPGQGSFRHRRTASSTESSSSHSHWVRAAKWAPDGRIAASCGEDKLVKLWDLEARRCVKTLYDHEAAVRDLAFSPDGTCLVAGSEDASVNVWDLRSYALLQHYEAHTAAITQVALDPSGRYLASSSLDATLKLYDLRRGQLLYTLKAHKGPLGCCAFAPTTSGHIFASGAADKVVNLWQADLNGILSPHYKQHAAASKTMSKKAQATQPNTKIPSYSRVSAAPPAPQQTNSKQAVALPLRSAPDPSQVDNVLDEFVAQAQQQQADTFQQEHQPTGRAFPNLEALTEGHQNLPEVVASTLDHIVGQLNVITNTIGMLDQRLSITEARLASLTVSNTSQSNQTEDTAAAAAQPKGEDAPAIPVANLMPTVPLADLDIPGLS